MSMMSEQDRKRLRAEQDIKEQQKLLETKLVIDPSKAKEIEEIRKVIGISFVLGLGLGALITVIIYKIRS
jgi:hypothetical protein